MKRISLFTFLISMFTRVELYAQSSESFTLTDYSILEHWAAHPWKRDMADSVPATIRMNYRPDTSLADIFFIHPTSYLDVGKPFGWNAPVDDPELNKMTDEGSILFQASIFNEAGRVFAPRYQQANIEAYFTLNQAASERALNNAYADVKAAFQYYLAHYNNGRPIVIASHSQGSTHSQRLVKELFDGKALQSQLVVAYIIGMDVNPSQYVNTTECTKPLQNACVCSWRTYETGYIPLYIKLEQFKSIVTNPLTWDSSAPSAARSKNLGSTLINFNLIQSGLVNADAKAKVLWVETGPLKNIIPTSDFHSSDMNLYYMNIRENVKERIDAWYAVKKKKEKSYNLTDPLFMEQ